MSTLAPRFMHRFRWLRGQGSRALIGMMLLTIFASFGVPVAKADLRAAPVWYDQNAVNTTPDWHYRIPISVPAGATVNSTVKFDVDFAAQLTALGINGTFDINSPRVVRSTGALATNQEYTDTVFAGATDATGNSRGEVRFILQDAGAVTYYLYFDITANGAKPANPQVAINGNFESDANGTTTVPEGWATRVISGAQNAEVRASENPSITDASSGQTRTTDGTPLTGANSYLLGERTGAQPNGSNPGTTLTRTFVVPATTPGNLTLRWRPEGWDSSANAATTFDFIRIEVVGATTTEVVGPTAANYVTKPFSPNFALQTATNARSGYGQYNGFDCTTTAVHQNGMTVGCNSEPWFTVTQSLAAWAGQTVTLRIRTFTNDAQYRSWYHVDDVEWSVVTATLGTPQAFGTNITLPAAAATFTGGQKLSITAQVDAQPTAAGNPVTADVFDNVGTLVATGIILYNDGTHGDVTANDAIWSNNGLTPASPTYTIPAGAPSGANWLLRVYARDASTSTIGATAGLVHIPAQANAPFSQANFYNVDEINFTVNTPLLTNLKTVAVISDPFNGAVNPKNIPGAFERYTITITNSGSGTVDNNTMVIVDPVPANTELFTGNFSGGAPYSFVTSTGTEATGLTCPFTALGNLTDCVDFSNNGGVSWTYVPNGTFDPAVTHVRFTLTGAMAADAPLGAPSPNIAIGFQVRIK
ncbi:MAG TPA: hypothetical protein VKM35_10865 [Arenimonas sp.]|uniref:hypothetical protein n=1 Tax=Arenimonas sp. TaxID=1872635 RepID=UPI002C786C25|nr:hypothetical protein [Arenimonas sp.]HMB57696.1 hypothetical protein [Arenimonas sp.]